ncbi:sulfite exporter TauE/SafE family protein [Mycolicibacterium sp. 22603]|uniref:sulfite exporter TauE/SafE family protein n=1 Tax=Mycolicibacterium sp. 22603 TaxID=3453950 RepID=UPI003F84A0EE
MSTVAPALALGAVIGVLLGLLGGGGSILAVPALVYALGLTFQQAIPLSLIVVGLASAVGALPKIRHRQVQWRLVAIFALTGMPATAVGTAVGKQLPQNVLTVGFALIMVIAGVRMLRGGDNTGTACRLTDGSIDWRRCAGRSIPVGILVGLLTGVFGVGGGFLIIPALVLLLGVEMPTAIGTSLLIITANAAAGIVSHLGTPIDWSIAAAFALPAILGSLLAGHWGVRLDTRRLNRWFAVLIFVVAAYLIVDTCLIRV